MYDEAMNQTTYTARQSIGFAGGRHEVARVFGVTYQAVYQWEVKGIPAARVPVLSMLSGISAEQIRPDLYRIPEMSEPPEA